MNKEDLPTISMSNTKKELLDAYAEVRDRVEEQRKELQNAEKARAAAEKKAAQVVAVQEAESDPVKRIHDLRGVLGKELLGLADRFEHEVQTFEKIQLAVQQKTDELEALYGIEAQVEDLSALIALHAEKKKAFEEQEQFQRQALDGEIAERRLRWEKEQKEADTRVEDARAERKLKWKREQEEYDYALNREREQRRNELEDELNALNREIEIKQSEFDTTCVLKQEELTRRERMVSEREKVMDELQQKVDTFPASVDKAVRAAVVENTEKLTAEFKGRESLATAMHEGKSSVLQSRIESLEKQVEMQLTQIEQLSARQESAYQKVQDIASRAVDSARREYVPFAPPSGQQRSNADQ